MEQKKKKSQQIRSKEGAELELDDESLLWTAMRSSLMRWTMQKILQTWEQAEEALCANDGTGGDVEVDSGVPYALRICFDAL